MRSADASTTAPSRNTSKMERPGMSGPTPNQDIFDVQGSPPGRAHEGARPERDRHPRRSDADQAPPRRRSGGYGRRAAWRRGAGSPRRRLSRAVLPPIDPRPTTPTSP